MNKKDVLNLLLELLEGTEVGVNYGNMDLYDESPDTVVGHGELINSIKRKLEDGEPCGHKGCLNHVTHPCEQCGRIAGRVE